MLMLSGPVELFVLLDLMASKTCMEDIVMLDGWRFFVCLSMSLFSCEVEYFVACTNCLLKAVAIWMLEVFSLLLKLIVLFDCCLGELFESECMVFQSMCVLCL